MPPKSYLEVEPKILGLPIGKWVNQEIFFTNIISETYQNIAIALRPPWQVRLKQTRYALSNLDPGVSKSIIVGAQVNAQPGESLPLQLTIHIDEKPPQKLSLSVLAEEADEGESIVPIKPKEVLPNVNDFEQELSKLNTDELKRLCRHEMFDTIYNSLVGADMMNSDRIEKIIDYCKRRTKFRELLQALKETFPQYTFFNH